MIVQDIRVPFYGLTIALILLMGVVAITTRYSKCDSRDSEYHKEISRIIILWLLIIISIILSLMVIMLVRAI